MATDTQNPAPALARAWAMLEAQTPLRHDCGALCGAACCQADEDGQGGVHLFPGERALLGDITWGEVVPSGELGGAEMLLCHGPCPRDRRPLGCRLFPLTPIRRGGAWTVRLDRRAWAVCPLMPSGMRGLSGDFVEACGKAVQLLGEDAQCDRFMRAWAALERSFHQSL